MCLLSLPKQICKNKLLAQRNPINVIKNGTKTCIEAILKPSKLNTLVKIMLVLFQSFYFAPFLQVFCFWLL